MDTRTPLEGWVTLLSDGRHDEAWDAYRSEESLTDGNWDILLDMDSWELMAAVGFCMGVKHIDPKALGIRHCKRQVDLIELMMRSARRSGDLPIYKDAHGSQLYVRPPEFVKWWSTKNTLPDMPDAVRRWFRRGEAIAGSSVAQGKPDDVPELRARSPNKRTNTNAERAVEVLRLVIYFVCHHEGKCVVNGKLKAGRIAAHISRQPQEFCLPDEEVNYYGAKHLAAMLRDWICLGPARRPRSRRYNNRFDAVRREYLHGSVVWCIADSIDQAIESEALNVDWIVDHIDRNYEMIWPDRRYERFPRGEEVTILKDLNKWIRSG